jgi:hypothetical protein
MSLSKNVCVRLRVHVCVCASACVSVCVCARVRLCACVCVFLGLTCESACFWFCLCARARESVCESACVRVLALAVARRGPAVLTARPATRGRPTRARCVGVGHRSVRFCARRRDVDEPYDQRAVGCATFPHVRGRRRRRHLRHRRRRQRRHPPAGCVGEHRRRCGPDSRGVVGG